MCTNLLIKSKNNSNIVSARTMDFGEPFLSKAHLIPRGRSFPSFFVEQVGVVDEVLAKWFKKYKLLHWKNTYGYISMKMAVDISCKLCEKIPLPTSICKFFKEMPLPTSICKFFKEMPLPTSIDGMNEKGLSGGALWLPCTQFPEASQTKQNIVCIGVLDYILGTCATISEVKTALNSINVINIPLVDLISKKIATEHFVFHDREGNSLIVEFENKKMVMYDNPKNGVLTNEPFYHKQLKGLQKYEKLSFHNNMSTLCEGSFSQETNGSGMVGLPADATPESRFVRAVKFSDAITGIKIRQDWVTQASRILDTLQVPKGTILGKDRNKVADYTQWSVIREHRGEAGMNYYFSTWNNPVLYKIELNNVNWDATENKMVELSQPGWSVDKTSLFM